MYQEGAGVTQSNAEAFRWHMKATERGHMGAQFIVGDLFNMGHCGVAQSDVEAARWFKKSAEQGFSEAQV